MGLLGVGQLSRIHKNGLEVHSCNHCWSDGSNLQKNRRDPQTPVGLHQNHLGKVLKGSDPGVSTFSTSQGAGSLVQAEGTQEFLLLPIIPVLYLLKTVSYSPGELC